MAVDSAKATLIAFDANKLKYTQYQEYLKEHEDKASSLVVPEFDTVWVTKRYSPTDQRVQVPVPRYKLLRSAILPPVEKDWVPPSNPPLRSFHRTQSKIYAPFPSTRCEDFSTLRQMLPSSGSVHKERPPNWGTGHVYAHLPIVSERAPTRFPRVNSPMTR